MVKADFERLGHMLRDLLSNALKFTSEGGRVIVEAKEKDSTVEV